MSKHITKEIDYITHTQFMSELEELKKDYYVIGYVVNETEGRAFVALVKRGEENE